VANVFATAELIFVLLIESHRGDISGLQPPTKDLGISCLYYVAAVGEYSPGRVISFQHYLCHQKQAAEKQSALRPGAQRWEGTS